MIGLHVFPAEGVVLLAQFEPEGAVAFRDGGFGKSFPEAGPVGLIDNLVQRVEIEVLVRGKEGDMWLLDSAGNEEGLVIGCVRPQPLDNLADILAVLVLLVGQSASPASWRGLGIQFSRNRLLQFLPLFPVGTILDGSVLLLEFPARFPHDLQFVILETVEFMPCYLAMFVSGRVKDLSNARGPVTVFLEELGQGYRAGTLLPDVGGIVQNARRFRVETAEKGGTRGTADGILAESSGESHPFRGEPVEGGCMNGIIARR